MAGGRLTEYVRFLREGLWNLAPAWVRTLFFALPPARTLHIDRPQKRGVLCVPVSALTTPKDGAATSQQKIVDVDLPKTLLLKRTITTPPSSSGTYHSIAELDLMRRTPFTSDDVYWALEKPSAAKSNELTQWVIKKAHIAAFRKNLASHGYLVRKFTVAEETLADFTKAVSPRAFVWRRINMVLLLAIVGLAAIIWLKPAWQATSIVAQQKVTLSQLRGEALKLRSDIKVLEQSEQERTRFMNNVIRRPRAVDALRELTVALPDSVWINDLLFEQNKIVLNGETSESAADLVLQLTQSKLNYVPALTGPVSRTNNGKERFGIVFTQKARIE